MVKPGGHQAGRAQAVAGGGRTRAGRSAERGQPAQPQAGYYYYRYYSKYSHYYDGDGEKKK